MRNEIRTNQQRTFDNTRMATQVAAIQKHVVSRKNKIIRIILLLLLFPIFAGAREEIQTVNMPVDNGWHDLCAVARDAYGNTRETCIRVKVLNKGKK